MSCDWNYYYDFDSEMKLENWVELSRENDVITQKTEFTVEKGNFVLLRFLPWDYLSSKFVLKELKIDGRVLGKADSCAYIRSGGARDGWNLSLEAGKHCIEEKLYAFVNKDEYDSLHRYSLIPALPPVPSAPSCNMEYLVPRKEYHSSVSEWDTEGFTPGLGTGEKPVPGRFGFSKGDGVLDFGMPALGCMDKMYLCGHPKYKKPFRWSYSTLPENALRHGSYIPAETGIEKDEIRVNHLSVTWKAELAGEDFSCTYSLGTSGVITERPSGKMRISGLEFAGNYQYAMIPVKDDRIRIVTLKDLPSQIGGMAENFIMLFGSTEYPDLPFQIVFQKKPQNMKIRFTAANRLDSITFDSCPLIITATPFGIESFEPVSPMNSDRIRKMAERARFWSRAFMAFPVKCEEYYRNDHAAKRTFIRQKFSYRYIRDDWRTVPLELAPLPPAGVMSGLMQSDHEEDFEFPTKFGPLHGAFGNVSGYSLPFMEIERKFPLKEKGSPLSGLLKDGLQEYLDLVTQIDPDMITYPYAGALMEPFAFASTLMNFMDEKSRETLRKYAERSLKKACTTGEAFDYPVINHGYMMRTEPDDKMLVGIYNDPKLEHLKLWNWYRRTEPFTKTTYDICYINLCFFSSKQLRGEPEEVAAFKLPMIENDWGVGLTFYYMYLCALATGNWEPVREKLPLIKSVFSFFVKMNDWACLGTGYSDNAMLWIEGANYGAFTSYIHIAEACGDKAAYEEGIYIAARQFALRCSILRAGQHYFCKYYDTAPWYMVKALHEEGNPSWQFQTVLHSSRTAGDKDPGDNRDALFPNRLRPEGIYNMTTEGLYPEIFQGFRKYLREDAEDVFLRMRLMKDPDGFSSYKWGLMQETASTLMDLSLDDDKSEAALREYLEFARSSGHLMQQWRGIHIPSRRLPKNYLETQVLAWNAMKKHPAWLETWRDLRIETAEFDPETRTAEIVYTVTGKDPELSLGIRKVPVESSVEGKVVNGEKWVIRPAASGKLILRFA